MGDYVDPEWRKHAEKSGLPKEVTNRKIIKCSHPESWYAGMVGQIVTVHYFSTFGAWTPEGKWIYFYDLSPEIGLRQASKPPNDKKGFFKKIFWK